MREELARQTETAAKFAQARELDHSLVRYQGDQIDQLKRQLVDVAKALGDSFYGLPAPTVKAEEWERNCPYRMSRSPSLDSLCYLPTEHLCSMVEGSIHELSHIQARIKRDRITDAVHVWLETPDGVRSYALSPGAWDQMRRDTGRMTDKLTRIIAAEMARFIARGKT